MIKSLYTRLRSHANLPHKAISKWVRQDIINKETATMLESVLNVANMHVREIMVPKSLMCTIGTDTPLEDYLAMIIETGHSRFPLIDAENDRTVGTIMAKDILKYTMTDKLKDIDIRELARPAKVVPEGKRLNMLLREFRLSHKHMAVVINEYGSISGLITIEDVLEQIVGDIIDEFDVTHNSTIDRIGKNQYEMSALTPIEACNQEIGTQFKIDAYDTMGGIVMNTFGRMPERNEIIEIDGHKIKVISCDHRHIKQIQITIQNI